jgi:hypothetical protein
LLQAGESSLVINDLPCAKPCAENTNNTSEKSADFFIGLPSSFLLGSQNTSYRTFWRFIYPINTQRPTPMSLEPDDAAAFLKRHS